MSDELPDVEFAFPGPLRDRLVSAILTGEKCATSSLVQFYEADGSALPEIGQRGGVLDSDGKVVAVIETTGVEVVALRDVPLQHAIDEGEGFTSVDEWRAAHLRFWTSPEVLSELGQGVSIDDGTPVLLERFALIETR
ncbi:MAG: ASCH domain-containing protein [Protaetiibacter sp.]